LLDDTRLSRRGNSSLVLRLGDLLDYEGHDASEERECTSNEEYDRPVVARGLCDPCTESTSEQRGEALRAVDESIVGGGVCRTEHVSVQSREQREELAPGEHDASQDDAETDRSLADIRNHEQEDSIQTECDDEGLVTTDTVGYLTPERTTKTVTETIGGNCGAQCFLSTGLAVPRQALCEGLGVSGNDKTTDGDSDEHEPNQVELRRAENFSSGEVLLGENDDLLLAALASLVLGLHHVCYLRSVVQDKGANDDDDTLDKTGDPETGNDGASGLDQLREHGLERNVTKTEAHGDKTGCKTTLIGEPSRCDGYRSTIDNSCTSTSKCIEEIEQCQAMPIHGTETQTTPANAYEDTCCKEHGRSTQAVDEEATDGLQERLEHQEQGPRELYGSQSGTEGLCHIRGEKGPGVLEVRDTDHGKNSNYKLNPAITNEATIAFLGFFLDTLGVLFLFSKLCSLRCCR